MFKIFFGRKNQKPYIGLTFMKQTLLFALLLFSLPSVAQITIIGHNRLNNTPIAHATLTVKENGLTTRTLTTGKSPDFMLQLEQGRDYAIYFEHPRCARMFMEVHASQIPEDRRAIKMIHELNVAFFDRSDEDVDTSMLQHPFQKIVFDGTNKMISDSAHANHFNQHIVPPVPASEKRAPGTAEKPLIVAGRVLLNRDPKMSVNDQPLEILDQKGQVIKTTFTNRFGAFSFTGVQPSQIARVRLRLKEPELASGYYTLVTAKNNLVATTWAEGTLCTWSLSTEEAAYLNDDLYSLNIGGKLILSSAKKKEFFANKTVYLCNRLNTVVKKTTSNILGTFVFENLKPDNSYFISVDKSELKQGERVDLLNKDEKYIGSLDTVAGGRASMRFASNYNRKFNAISISDDEMMMSVKATIYGDNTNNPIGRLKVIMLNDNYQVIDSATTDDFGAFRFKYLPFVKRFYLSAENSDNMLDGFTNILIYNKDYNLVKIMTHEKGNKFSYKPLQAEMFRLRELEIDDPWLEFVDNKTPKKKLIVENIFFDSDKYLIGDRAKEVLNKVAVVMKANSRLKIEIGAHTDSKGSVDDNLKLSASRARTVMEYLVSVGIQPHRLVCKGYGETELLNSCADGKPCSEMEHARNRRIEFKILEE